MIYAFDTLGYAKRLRDAGVSQEHAEAHAEAAREFVMGELVTRYDLDMATTLIRLDFEKSIATFRKDMETSMEAFRRDIDRLVLRLTLRLGGMSAVSVAILAAIIKL